ncbi:P-loop containing nucleoside triphosphate hydrolase protein [Chytriomyces sp. MP71]|nr:P-loop containing nucleoside triphosphate hydrolase protein [Chytriomyces sp. MP71]
MAAEKTDSSFLSADMPPSRDRDLLPEFQYPEVNQPGLPNAESKANLLSQITFGWYTGLIKRGWKAPLEMPDLFAVEDHRRSLLLVQEFEALIRPDKNGTKMTVLRAFIYMHRFFPIVGIGKIVADGAISCTSLIMKWLLVAIIASQSADPPPAHVPYLYALGFFLLSGTSSLLNAFVFQHSSKVAVAAKGMITAAIYRKSLKLNGVGRAQFSSGKILNHVASDIARLEMSLNTFNMTWTAPFYFFITIGLLMVIIGPSGLAGIGFLFLCMPLQALMIRRLMLLRGAIAPVTDKRIKLSSEILQGIRIIKYFSWEDTFSTHVDLIREREELGLVRNAAFIRSIISCLGFALPAVSASITFLVYGALNAQLGAVQIFASLALFNQLRQHVMWLPLQISALGDSVISFRRLQELFDAPEVDFHPLVNPDAEFGVEVVDAEFEWEAAPPPAEVEEGKGKKGRKNSKKAAAAATASVPPVSVKEDAFVARPTLRNINLKCPKGELTCIVGAVGSGKSSLLASLISELKCNRGSVVFSGNVGYTPQQAWIVNATVKENILFGRAYDAERYERVVNACCLSQDFKILPNGDMSEIGERGINISGGQKQRISLARLMYTDHQIALLDDPLSAVDSHVGRAIFENGICGILASKTRLLVTHQLHHVPNADWVVFLKNGNIAEQGTYAELIAAGGEFSALMAAYGGDQADAEEDEEMVPTATETRRNDSSATLVIEDKLGPQEERKPIENAGTQAETKQTGSISFNVMKSYFQSSGSNTFLLFTLGALLFTQAARLANDIWLVQWTNSVYPSLNRNAYMGIYAGLSVLQALSLLSYSLFFAVGGIQASKSLHKRVFERLMQCPVGFYDQTPLGRIINRLSRDVDVVDNTLYDALRLLFYSFLQVISAFSLVSYITNGVFLAVLVPLMGLYVTIQIIYRRSSRELKRIESLSRSPLYAHISECLAGLATIRAYADQDRFIGKMHALVDANSSPMVLLFTGQRWIGTRLEFIGNVLVLAVGLYASWRRFTVSPSQMGLALSYLLQTTALLNMLVFQMVECEVQLNAVERLVEYLELPSEPSGGASAPANWPSKGTIEFRNVQMRYQPNLPLVLNGINVKIQGGEKIGVVGRTGSGKSSLMQALFRIVNLAEGSIVIDGVDTSTLTLRDLRTRLAIIPQDPVLFSGELRNNLDPNKKFTDQEIWDVLERCGMKDAVAEMEGKLDCVLVENAENVSVGQRQLLCLARACLQRPQILVLDECTASVDMVTDALIQKTIQEEFKYATTLTIAHRLNTIIASSKILVLGEGRVIEFDTPRSLLLEKLDSQFGKMVDETGDANAAMLRSLV